MRPAMIRMNPTVPTVTGTIIPMIRIRSAEAPSVNSAEDPQGLRRQDAQHEEDRDRRREGPARDLFVEAVQAFSLSAVVQVGDERAERQRHRRQEQEQGLARPEDGAVHADLGRPRRP